MFKDPQYHIGLVDQVFKSILTWSLISKNTMYVAQCVQS